MSEVWNTITSGVLKTIADGSSVSLQKRSKRKPSYLNPERNVIILVSWPKLNSMKMLYPSTMSNVATSVISATWAMAQWAQKPSAKSAKRYDCIGTYRHRFLQTSTNIHVAAFFRSTISSTVVPNISKTSKLKSKCLQMFANVWGIFTRIADFSTEVSPKVWVWSGAEVRRLDSKGSEERK